MENKKYEFTGETREWQGITLKRIRALVTIAGVVSSGDAGGWIESENNLQVDGDAWVDGDARVYGNAAFCAFIGFGSSYRQTTAYYDSKIGVRVVCDCFTGTIDEFRESIRKTHGENSQHGKLYMGMANMIEVRLPNARKDRLAEEAA